MQTFIIYTHLSAIYRYKLLSYYFGPRDNTNRRRLWCCPRCNPWEKSRKRSICHWKRLKLFNRWAWPGTNDLVSQLHGHGRRRRRRDGLKDVTWSGACTSWMRRLHLVANNTAKEESRNWLQMLSISVAARINLAMGFNKYLRSPLHHWLFSWNHLKAVKELSSPRTLSENYTRLSLMGPHSQLTTNNECLWGNLLTYPCRAHRKHISIRWIGNHFTANQFVFDCFFRDGINKQSFTGIQFMYWRTVFLHFTSTRCGCAPTKSDNCAWLSSCSVSGSIKGVRVAISVWTMPYALDRLDLLMKTNVNDQNKICINITNTNLDKMYLCTQSNNYNS